MGTCCESMVVVVGLDGELTASLSLDVESDGGDGGAGATTSGIAMVVWMNDGSTTNLDLNVHGLWHFVRTITARRVGALWFIWLAAHPDGTNPLSKSRRLRNI